MRYQDYYMIEREGIFESSDGRKHKHKRIAVPRSKIVGYLPTDSQKKLMTIVPRGCDLNLIHNTIIREFHRFIRSRKKENLKPIEFVGEIEILDGVRVIVEARRHRDKFNLGNHALVMNKNYKLMVLGQAEKRLEQAL